MQYLQIKFSDSVHGKSNETLHFIPMSKVDNFRLKDCVLCPIHLGSSASSLIFKLFELINL